jgi:putative aminopeptidase FrvX
MAPVTKERAVEILSQLDQCAATSFYEQQVVRYVVGFLERIGLEFKLDKYGNVIVHYMTDPKRQPVGYIAHMDHPGFEISGLDDQGFIVARALGGVPVTSFEGEIKVKIIMGNNEETIGILSAKDNGALDRQVMIQLPDGTDIIQPAYAVFDLPDFALLDDFIHMRALDDLAGCASILAVLESLASQSSKANFYGIFSRAEEVGLIGARLVARDKLLPENTTIVSIEASRTLPGAEQGGGPVIRAGDASYTFDGGAEGLLRRAGSLLKEKDSSFQYQRQLMSGGTCEATAFALQGYHVTGLAYPLGNYHNQGSPTEAFPSGSVELENIHLNDFYNGIRLLTEALTLRDDDDTPLEKRLANVPIDEEQQLINSSHVWTLG